ncbi:hypothetical protein PFISCL1PPCAC_10489, partial [Pristionchus fissidentatus]
IKMIELTVAILSICLLFFPSNGEDSATEWTMECMFICDQSEMIGDTVECGKICEGLSHVYASSPIDNRIGSKIRDNIFDNCIDRCLIREDRDCARHCAYLRSEFRLPFK